MPDLKFSVRRFAPREGGYSRGAEGYELILQTALSVLVDHGYKAMTLRRIATECGMKAGNITYYFKNKNDLVRALLQAIAGGYEEAIASSVDNASDDPEIKLKNLIKFILDDGATKQTAYIFPELWSLANHDPFVKERVDELYAEEHIHFSKIVSELNPALGDEERNAFLLSSLEGVGIFAGYGKRWSNIRGPLQDIACDCFVQYVKNMKPEDVVDLSEIVDADHSHVSSGKF